MARHDAPLAQLAEQQTLNLRDALGREPEPVDLDQYCVRKLARVGGLINEYRPGRMTWTRFPAPTA
jgi:hypothetical protein